LKPSFPVRLVEQRLQHAQVFLGGVHFDPREPVVGEILNPGGRNIAQIHAVEPIQKPLQAMAHDVIVAFGVLTLLLFAVSQQGVTERRFGNRSEMALHEIGLLPLRRQGLG